MRAVPRLCELYPDICLTTEEKARKTLIQGKVLAHLATPCSAVQLPCLCAQQTAATAIRFADLARLVFGGVRFAACKTNTTQNQPHQISNTQRTENKTTDVVIQQHSRKLLMMDILMSETCWAHKKWNKISSDIKLVFHASASPDQSLEASYWDDKNWLVEERLRF